MSLFGKIIKTTINITLLPVAITKDIFTLGGVGTEQEKSYTSQQIDLIKKESDD